MPRLQCVPAWRDRHAPRHNLYNMPPLDASLAALPPSSPRPAEAGSWVRLKAGIYKHDLAKVIEADPSNQVCCLAPLGPQCLLIQHATRPRPL